MDCERGASIVPPPLMMIKGNSKVGAQFDAHSFDGSCVWASSSAAAPPSAAHSFVLGQAQIHIYYTQDMLSRYYTGRLFIVYKVRYVVKWGLPLVSECGWVGECVPFNRTAI